MMRSVYDMLCDVSGDVIFIAGVEVDKAYTKSNLLIS